MIETLNSKGGLEKSDVKNLISMVKVKIIMITNKKSTFITLYVMLKKVQSPQTNGQIRYCKL